MCVGEGLRGVLVEVKDRGSRGEKVLDGGRQGGFSKGWGGCSRVGSWRVLESEGGSVLESEGGSELEVGGSGCARVRRVRTCCFTLVFSSPSECFF